MDTQNRPSIYYYLHYGEFLDDLKNYFEKQGRPIKFESIGAQLGLRSRTQAKKILKGKVELSKLKMEKIFEIFDLSQSEREFFDLLRRYQFAKSPEGASVIYKNILKQRESQIAPSKQHQLEEAQLEILEEWYHVPMVHYFELKNNSFEAEEIVTAFKGKLTLAEVRHSLEKLTRLGILKRDPVAGSLKLVHTALRLLDGLPRPLVRKYHQMMIERAIDAMHTLPLQKRTIMASTLTVHESTLPEINQEISQFLEKIAHNYSIQKGDAVYQLNVQLYNLISLTKKEDDNS